MNTFKNLFRWILPNIHYLFISITAIIIATYTRTYVPKFTQHVIDSVIGDKESELPQFILNILNKTDSINEELMLVGLFLLTLTFFRAIVIFVRGRVDGVFAEKTTYLMRTKLYNHQQNLSYSYHTHVETGDLIQRSTSDIDTVRKFIGSQLPEVSRMLFLFIFFFIAMIQLHAQLAYISVILVPIIFMFSFVYFRKVQKLFKTTDESEAKMSAALQENLTGIRVVKAFAREKYEIDKFTNLTRKYADNVQKLIDSLATYWSVSDLTVFIQICISLTFGAYLTITGQITVGVFTFFIYAITNMLWPVRGLGRIISDFGQSSVALKRIQDVLDTEDEYVVNGSLKPEINGNIEFINTSFKFEDANVPALTNINLSINHGETIAIVGKTGSGKSTLVHLLVRLFDYTSGSLKINGVELKDIDKQWIRKNIGIILQEPFLYSRSIYENIGITGANASKDQVYQAAKIASIHNDIVNFEKGYKTMIGERGVTLSGGQKQRVAIARMLLEERPILIFDDSLSAVDTETDLSIRSALEGYKNEITKIIITHRITTAMEADKIIVLNDGQIVEIGKHEDLVMREGLYKKIWEIQRNIQKGE